MVCSISAPEKSGALRDMVQNHLMQLFCLTAMEAPNAINADSVRGEKVIDFALQLLDEYEQITDAEWREDIRQKIDEAIIFSSSE